MKCALLIIGNEITDGTIEETNSQWILNQLHAHSITASMILSVRDEVSAIYNALSFLSQKHNLIITTGGLGPTGDDLTREAIARFFNLPLIEDREILLTIRKKFKKAGIPFSKENNKQAQKIDTSILIPNRFGTAPGFIVDREIIIASFPGVPSEMKDMFHFLPKYLEHKKTKREKNQIQSFWIRTVGLSESMIDEIINNNTNPLITIGTMAHLGQVDIRFDVKTVDRKKAEKLLENLLDNTPEVKRKTFSREINISLPEVIIRLLKKQHFTIAGAESCTGGLLGKLLTDIPGSSAVYNGGIISYNNSVKEKILGVSHHTLEKHGAVSFETAIEMRQGLEKLFPNTNIHFSITGIAGPDGGNKSKPIGTVFISLKTPSVSSTFHFVFPGNREQIRIRTAFKLLELIWTSLQDLSLDSTNIYGIREIKD